MRKYLRLSHNNVIFSLNDIGKWANNHISHSQSSMEQYQLWNKTTNPIPVDDSVKYMGIHLDKQLIWGNHIWLKRKQPDTKFCKHYWLLGKKSLPSNKLVVYNSVFKPAWVYGLHTGLWGTASKSNSLLLPIIVRFQTKQVLRAITDVPWFVSNKDICSDLNLPIID